MKITPAQQRRLHAAAARQYDKYYGILDTAAYDATVSKQYADVPLRDLVTKLKFYNYILNEEYGKAHRLYDDVDSIGHDLPYKTLDILCKAVNCQAMVEY